MKNILFKGNNVLRVLDDLCEGYPITLLGNGRKVVLSCSGNNAADYQFVADIEFGHGRHRQVVKSRFDLMVDYFSSHSFDDLYAIVYGGDDHEE